MNRTALLSSLFIVSGGAAIGQESWSVNDRGQRCIAHNVLLDGKPILFQTGSANGDYNAGELAQDFRIFLPNTCNARLKVKIYFDDCRYIKNSPSFVQEVDIPPGDQDVDGHGYPNLRPTCKPVVVEITGPRPAQGKPALGKGEKGEPAAAQVAKPVGKLTDQAPATPKEERPPEPDRGGRIAACVKSDESGLGISTSCDAKLGDKAFGLCQQQGRDLLQWCANRYAGLPQAEIFDSMTKRKQQIDAMAAKATPEKPPLQKTQPEKTPPQFTISAWARKRATGAHCTEYQYDRLREGSIAYGPLWEAGEDRVVYNMRCSPLRLLQSYCEEAESEFTPSRPPGKLFKVDGQVFCVRR